MKTRSIIFFVIVALSTIALVACGNGSTNPKNVDNGNEKIAIYTTIFPLYDFASKIAGDLAVVENIVPPGVEPHDFEPSVKDMMMLNEADLLLYNGAGFEGWVEKAIAAMNNDQLTIVEASKHVKLLQMEEESSHEGEHEHDHYHGDWDPHTWLDPNQAKIQAETIKNALVEIDPKHQDVYSNNYQSLVQQFDELDRSLKDLSEHVQKREVVVSHASFGYLTHAYDLKQIAISGLSPSAEPTQRELQEIIETIKKHGVNYILFETLISGKVAEVVKKEVGAEALTLNPLENLTENELNQGKDYFSIMKENIEVLKTALEYSH